MFCYLLKFQSYLVFFLSECPAPCSQLEKLIKRGVSVNALTKNNFSALHLSTYRVGDFCTIKKTTGTMSVLIFLLT